MCGWRRRPARRPPNGTPRPRARFAAGRVGVVQRGRLPTYRDRRGQQLCHRDCRQVFQGQPLVAVFAVAPLIRASLSKVAADGARMMQKLRLTTHPPAPAGLRLPPT